ncbi:Hypothetical protein NF53_p5051 (plasmid) [Bacillus thuringiensis serovar indiana]|nr:Hypothetical protein NF53_p5051 [Bacillus thuringiensis serovar indiana]
MVLVAPYIGARIEIFKASLPTQKVRVAPLAGAWIEINPAPVNAANQRRTLYRCES